MEGNQRVTVEKEVEIDGAGENHVEVNYPGFFDTQRHQQIENNPSSHKDDNEEIIIVQDDSNPEEVKSKKQIEEVKVMYPDLPENTAGNIIIQKDSNKFVNIHINTNNNVMRKSEHKPSTGQVAQKYFNEDIYKDVLFFFINPISGSHEGQTLIDMEVKKVEFLDNNKSLSSSAYIFNILDEESYKSGVALLKDYQYRVPRSLPKVVIGGGDGTILKVIEKLQSEKVNVQNCNFGILPLGNNNTLSQALGWGDNLGVSPDMSKFKLIVKDLVEASSTFVDIWRLTLRVANDGEIVQIEKTEGETKKHTKVEEKEQMKQTVIRSSFINYFSIGLDARIGFGFEKSRTKARCCNKCVYLWETCKKSCCRKTMKVNSFIETFSVIKMEEINLNMSQISELENRGNKVEIFTTKHEPNLHNQSENYSSSHKKYENVVLKGNPVTLICQNINYYVGSKEDIWKKSTTLGIELQSKGPLTKDELKEKEELEKKEFKDLMEGEQSINDGKLEFFTFQSGMSYDMEGILSGLADKVYHGRGPIHIKFKDTPGRSEEDKENRIYLNIDGEYYHIIKPAELKVRPNKLFEEGKLRFLCKKKE